MGFFKNLLRSVLSSPSPSTPVGSDFATRLYEKLAESDA
jgi:hypothetical protein